MGKKLKSVWKPVTLTGTLASQDFDDLIGIEELTDYCIENKETLTQNSGKDDRKKKRKLCYTENGTKCTLPPKKSKKFMVDKKEGDVQPKKDKKKVKTKEVVDKQLQCKSVLLDSSTNEPSYLDSIPPGMEAWGCCCTPLPVIRALEDLGFQQPTEIQALTLPAAIKGRRDILGAAETGSGKTLAFGIPIIHGILMQKKKESKVASAAATTTTTTTTNLIYNKNTDSRENQESVSMDDEMSLVPAPKKRLFALILTPTRELAIQVKNHLIAAAKYTDIKVATVVGGMASQKQERLLNQGPEIVVATPGRLWELIQEGNPHLQQVNEISFLAIDETDRMLEKGHFQELQMLMERMNSDAKKVEKRQTFVFSATLTLVHEPPKYANKGSTAALRITPGQKLQQIITSLGITHPKIVDVTAKSGTAKMLSEARIVCQLDEKDFYLYYFLQQHCGRTLVFCNSIGCVRRLAQLLGLLQCRPLPLHANMQQRQRLRNLDHFRDRADGLLLATDVAARGLDIPNVEHVIHYQVPRTSEIYVHRSGRTARAMKEGLTLLLMEPKEINCYVQLCKTLGRERDLSDFPVDDNILSAVKTRVILARKLDQLELQFKKKNSKATWFQKAAEEMDLILDDDEMPDSFSAKETADMKRQIKALKYQLQTLLDMPVFPKGRSLKYPSQIGKEQQQPKRKATEVIKKAQHEPGAFVKLAR